MGVSENAIGIWRKEIRTPEPESCAKIADYTGYPVEFIMHLAGHYPGPGAAPSIETSVEVIPELGVILRRMSPWEQRRWMLPAARVALGLKDEGGQGDAPPPQSQPASESDEPRKGDRAP